MKAFFTERNIVIILFVTVLVTFSLAQEDSKKVEKLYTGQTTPTFTRLVAEQAKTQLPGQVPGYRP